MIHLAEVLHSLPGDATPAQSSGWRADPRGSACGPVSYRALYIAGSLGTTSLTPLQAMWAGAPAMAIADGVDEVHKVTVAPTY